MPHEAARIMDFCDLLNCLLQILQLCQPANDYLVIMLVMKDIFLPTQINASLYFSLFYASLNLYAQRSGVAIILCASAFVNLMNT